MATTKTSKTSATKKAGATAGAPPAKAPSKQVSRGSANRAEAQSGPQQTYWLMKSEPDVFSWEMLKARGRKGEPWTGVRNFLARNNMRAMRVGDLGFFYHSNIGKEVVGILRVVALAHPDQTDVTGKWECVDVEAVADLPRPVTLDEAKSNPKLREMRLVTDTRLSVQPVTPSEWAEVCRMGGVDAAALK